MRPALGLALLACLPSCSRRTLDATTAVDAAPAPSVSSSAPDAAARENRIATFVAYDSYAEAFSAARPEMSGDPHLDGGEDRGPLLFGAWASVKMRWSDIAVAKDETNYGLVLRDTEEEIGKRLCATGRIDAIGALPLPAPAHKLFVAAIRRDDAVFDLLVAGSAGSLVKNDVGRFCGVVTGRHARAGDQRFPAVALVGMFDLPENR